MNDNAEDIQRAAREKAWAEVLEMTHKLKSWDDAKHSPFAELGFTWGFDAGRDSVVFPPHSEYRGKLREMICEGDFDFTKIFEEIEYEGEKYADISNDGADALADYFIGLMEQIDEYRSEDVGYSAANAEVARLREERDQMRNAAEMMVAAFDKRPEGEPEEIGRITRECALKCAKEDLGWPTTESESAGERGEPAREGEQTNGGAGG